MKPTTVVPVPRAVPSAKVLYTDILELVTQNSELGNIKNGAMLVTGNEISWCGRASDAPTDFDSIVSLKDCVVIPGMVNTHHHMNQTLTRCIAQDSPLFNWLTSLYPAWETMSGEDVYVASQIAMAELILSGCTTSSDHLYIFPNDVTVDDTIRAAREIGMRFHPTRGIMTLGKSKGGLPPDSCVEETDAALADAERLIKEFHDPEPLSMLRMGIAPCSPFSVTNDCMIGAAQMARKYPAVRLHTHLAENKQDIEFSLKTYKCRPGKYIEEVGWNKDDCWFAHCVMLDDAEMKQFASCGIGVCHCPSSNARLASGICPVRDLLDTGVNVGLGVDGSASNDSGNLLEQARWALMLQRGTKRDVSGLKVAEALEIATKGGARNLGRPDIGELAPGFAADFVAWKMSGNINFAGAMHDPLTAVFMCTPGPVHYSVINGEIIVEEGEFTSIDLKRLIDDHNERSARVCAAVGDPNA